ncbi:MAG: enoyl-CoA hydratase/isomerase family protein [Desulfobacterales bacterium]|nr:enoyl-CoA hydratase/isomerase family protein [Desulfobacterales bacterium]MBF0396867.1 enoyl-CoA hydratase/isomerase family protein [Desulfobacterales bacterium]
MFQETIEDNIIIFKFNNPPTNSIKVETLKKLQSVINEVNNNPEIKGLILTGEGRFFSSGFDLPMFLSFKNLDEIVEFFNFEENLLCDLFTCKKPVVSAINGHDAAGGLIFSMASDYRIVKNHPKIKIGMSEIKLGLPLSIAQFEVMRFGLDSDKKLRDILYFGDMIDVNRAKELQIVDEIVEDAELLKRAKQIVSLWIDTPGKPFITMKYMLKKHAADTIKTALQKNDWQERLNCFFIKEVRMTLEFVQATMAQKA